MKFPNKDNGYFGYSVGLLKTRTSKFWLLAGAPLSNSSGTKAIKRPGTFYKCPIDKPEAGCREVILDTSNNFERVKFDRHPIRDNAWTGSSLDVDNDGNVIVCAPRWKNGRYKDEYRISGACYLLGEDLGDNTAQFIDTLLDSDYQIYNHHGRGVYYYAHGQGGMSVHFANNTELLIGAPGVLNWQGSVAKYIRQLKVPIGGINKREASFVYTKPFIPNPIRTSKIQDSDFFGYSVTSGKFDNKADTYYVAGAPRGASLHGMVLVFMMRNYEMQPLQIKEIKTGTQVGEYFGASVAAPDLNGDGLSDLVVGAPLHSVEGLYDVGCVYVFINIKREEGTKLSSESVKLMGDISQLARFGISLGTPGDLDNDGYQDLLVGAPYENDNKGAVYVFMGTKNGIRELYQQKLLPEEAAPGGSLKGFGISFSRPLDVDANSYPDFAVGSFLSDEAALMSTRPVIIVRGELSSTPSKLSFEENFFTLQTCLLYEGKQFIDKIDFLANIYISQESERGEIVATFSTGSTEKIVEFSSVGLNDKMCKQFKVDLKLEKSNAQKPIVVRMDFELKNEHLKDTKNPVMSPHISFPPELVLSFVTGCTNEVCRSDLFSTATIKNIGLGSPLLIGALPKITLEVETWNRKDPAFLPNITISIPKPITVLPSVRDCSTNQDIDNTVVVCQLKNPLLTGEKDSISLELDLTHLDDSSSDISISGRSDSAADFEETPDDNIFKLDINVEKTASVEVNGYSRPEQYTYERLSEYEIILKENETVHVEHKFTVTKSGATPIRDVEVVVYLPYNLTYPPPYEEIQTLQDIEHKLYYSLSSNCELEFRPAKTPNKALPNVLHDSTFDEYPSRTNYLLKSLSCESPYTECALIKCKIGPWRTQNVATLSVSFNINLSNLNNAISLKDGFSLFTIVEVNIVSHKGTSLVEGKRFDNGTVQTIFYPGSLPAEPLAWWIYLAAAIGGIIVLLIIAFILYQIGFFKRKAKEELKAQQAHLISKDEGR